MPRGRRKNTELTISQQLQEIRDQISALKKREKDLIALQEKQAIDQLLEAAKAKGVTPAELVAELTAAKEQSAVNE